MFHTSLPSAQFPSPIFTGVSRIAMRWTSCDARHHALSQRRPRLFACSCISAADNGQVSSAQVRGWKSQEVTAAKPSKYESPLLSSLASIALSPQALSRRALVRSALSLCGSTLYCLDHFPHGSPNSAITTTGPTSPAPFALAPCTPSRLRLPCAADDFLCGHWFSLSSSPSESSKAEPVIVTGHLWQLCFITGTWRAWRGCSVTGAHWRLCSGTGSVRRTRIDH